MFTRLGILLFIASILTGCGTTYKEVKVRDYYCPAPNIPAEPTLAIHELRDDSTDHQVGIAYAKTVDQLLIYNKELLHELKAYEKMGAKDHIKGNTKADDRPNLEKKETKPVGDINSTLSKYDL